jgi:hypothetical protein
VQQLSVHDYYELGKKINQLERLIGAADGPVESRFLVWPLFVARWSVWSVLKEPCALLPGAQRAAQAFIGVIENMIPREIEDVLEKTASQDKLEPYQLSSVKDAISNFETILKNDMPEMATFAVAQIGMYRTEDLIKRSFLQVEEELRSFLLPLAKEDITEAGKCLAFRVPTAAGFHISRAIETGMNQYYEALSGEPFNLKDATKNWAVKTEALKSAGADKKITEFLVHLRVAYRNPITHPDAILTAPEAFGFFNQALSVISMMLAAVKELTEDKQRLLTGLYETSLSSAMLGAGMEAHSQEQEGSAESAGKGVESQNSRRG